MIGVFKQWSIIDAGQLWHDGRMILPHNRTVEGLNRSHNTYLGR